MSSGKMTLVEFLGQSEGPTLEFKSSAALRDPLTLPRAVCSFLNGRGGKLVVGVNDDGRTLDPVMNPGDAKRRLEDLLASTIAPSLPPSVEVQITTDEAGLVISVPKTAAAGRLHAVRSTQGRILVPGRVGARTLPLEWGEIVARIQAEKPISGQERSVDEMHDSLNQWAEACEGEAPELGKSGGLFLVLHAIPEDSDTTSEDWHGLDAELRSVLTDPSTLECRIGQAGFWWDLSGSVEREAVRRKTGRPEIHHRSGSRTEGYRVLDVVGGRSRELRFATRLDAAFTWGQTFDEKRTSNLLQPYTVSQTVSSCCRLFAHLLRQGGEIPAEILAALDLRGLAGRRLPPGEPVPGRGYLEHPSWPTVVGDPGPVVSPRMSGHEFVAKPDVAARRLLEQIYMRSGWSAADVPFFDSRRERFVYD